MSQVLILVLASLVPVLVLVIVGLVLVLVLACPVLVNITVCLSVSAAAVNTCDGAYSFTLHAQSRLLVSPQSTQQVRRRHVVLATPDAHVRHRLLILHQVEQTAQQLAVHPVMTRLQHAVNGKVWCANGCVVECRICNRQVAGSNLGRGCFAPRSTQPSIPPGSVNEYQLRLGRQRQVSAGCRFESRRYALRVRMKLKVCK